MRKAKLGPKTMVVAAVVLALVLVFAVTSTALAGSNEQFYKFDCSKFSKADLAKLTAMLHIQDWSKVGWCNIDFKKIDWSKCDWKKLLSLFHWRPCKTTPTTCPKPPTTCPKPPTTCTSDHVSSDHRSRSTLRPRRLRPVAVARQARVQVSGRLASWLWHWQAVLAGLRFGRRRSGSKTARTARICSE